MILSLLIGCSILSFSLAENVKILTSFWKPFVRKKLGIERTESRVERRMTLQSKFKSKCVGLFVVGVLKKQGWLMPKHLWIKILTGQIFKIKQFSLHWEVYFSNMTSLVFKTESFFVLIGRGDPGSLIGWGKPGEGCGRSVGKCLPRAYRQSSQWKRDCLYLVLRFTLLERFCNFMRATDSKTHCCY